MLRPLCQVQCPIPLIIQHYARVVFKGFWNSLFSAVYRFLISLSGRSSAAKLLMHNDEQKFICGECIQKNKCVWTAWGERLPPQRRTAHAEQTDCEAGDRPERRVTLRSGRPRTGHTQVFESHSGRPPKQNGGLFPLETMLKFQQYRSAAQSLPTDGREADHHTTPLSLKPREQRPQAKRSLQSPRPPEAAE